MGKHAATKLGFFVEGKCGSIFMANVDPMGTMLLDHVRSPRSTWKNYITLLPLCATAALRWICWLAYALWCVGVVGCFFIPIVYNSCVTYGQLWTRVVYCCFVFNWWGCLYERKTHRRALRNSHKHQAEHLTVTMDLRGAVQTFPWTARRLVVFIELLESIFNLAMVNRCSYRKRGPHWSYFSKVSYTYRGWKNPRIIIGIFYNLSTGDSVFATIHNVIPSP